MFLGTTLEGGCALKAPPGPRTLASLIHEQGTNPCPRAPLRVKQCERNARAASFGYFHAFELPFGL